MQRAEIKGHDEILALLGELSPAKAESALKISRLRASKSISADIAQRLSKHLFLKSSTIKSSIKTYFSGDKVSVRGWPIPVKSNETAQTAYQATQKTRKTRGKSRRMGIAVKIRRDKGTEIFRHGFITGFGQAKIRKWSRSGKIGSMYGPAIPAALEEHPGMLDSVVGSGAERYNSELINQIDRRLSGK